VRFFRIPLESRLLLAVASAVVPRRLKNEWRMEWEGEIWWWIATQPDAGRSVRERLALISHCVGAIADGFCLWFADEDRLAGMRAEFRKPLACFVAGMFLLALLGVLSSGFENTRRALQSTFFPRDPALAVLSQTGPFMGQRLGVPLDKVAYWDRHASSLQGTAVYTWYRSVIEAKDLPAAKVGARFFSLLRVRPQIGRVFSVDDVRSCADCVVVGYDFWKRHLGADPQVIGRRMMVDGRAFRVIGVLRKDFWFLDESPAVWSLFDEKTWKDFPVMMTGAICRLTPGTLAAVAGGELRALARQVMPKQTGTWTNVAPLDAIVRRPVDLLGPLLLGFAGFAFLGALGVLGVRGVRPAAFLLAKAVVLLTILFFAGIEFGGAASMTGIGGTTFVSATAFFWMFAAGGVALRWVWTDQRKRCPTCLCRLAMPVRIGEGSRRLLELSGTEMACPRGHGILFAGELGYCWSPLDVTWGELFEPVGK
jgi:hypothetical protein